VRKIRVRCREGNYDIVVGQGLLNKAGSFMKPLGLGPKVLLVSNRRVARWFLNPVKRSLKKSGFDVSVMLLPFGDERDKSEKVLHKIWKKMAEADLDRTSSVVALGGGVIGDVSGFAAATYMRGIAVVHLPTTLLAQVDSSIGGKTAIDLPVAKNIVGAFHQPKKVIMDTRVLETMLTDRLGKRAFISSWAEVIKYGVIIDPVLFAILEKHAKDFRACFKKGKFSPKMRKLIETVIWRSASAKAKVVSSDEFETKGKRVILNLGHTFAHGFEAASGYRLFHGEAVAVGMACAATVAAKIGTLSDEKAGRIHRLIHEFKLPTTFKGSRIRAKKVLSAMQKDKKKQAGQLRYVLPVRIGKVVVRQNISKTVVRRTLKESSSFGSECWPT